MATATLTEAGLNFIARVFAGTTSNSITKIAVGNGTPSSSGLGNEHTGNGFARATAGAISVSTYTLSVAHTFTASGADVTVTEFALYTDESSPTLIGYVQFRSLELSNSGIVPDGESILLTGLLTFSAGSTSYTGDGWNLIYNATIGVAFSASGVISPENFVCTTGLCYNGKAIRNGNIKSLIPFRGGKKWEIEAVTTDYTDIENLQQYASPTEVGVTVLGIQYVNSIMLPGVLKERKSDGTYTTHTNCYISGEISVETMGGNYFYEFTVVQAGTS